MLELLNTYLEETSFRCFCATFDCPENNPRRGIALFIYRRRIWPGSILDHLVRLRRICAIIRPTFVELPDKSARKLMLIFARTNDSRGYMRHFWSDFKETFVEMLRCDIQVQRRSGLPTNLRPLKEVIAPLRTEEWVIE